MATFFTVTVFVACGPEKEKEDVVVPDSTVTPPPSENQTGNKPTPTPTPVIVTATFASIKENIFLPKCSSCHTEGGSASGVPLNSKEDLIESPRELVIPFDTEESGLLIAIKRPNTDFRRMPPPGLEGLSSVEISAIEEWIKDGATK